MSTLENNFNEEEYVVEYTKTKGPVFLFLFGTFFPMILSVIMALLTVLKLTLSYFIKTIFM